MKTYEIYFFHGYDEKLYKKLGEFCIETHLSNGKVGLVYRGSLDEFQRLYNDKFIVYPEFIAVTQHSNFGQR